MILLLCYCECFELCVTSVTAVTRHNIFVFPPRKYIVHQMREMFEFYATKSCLFLLKAMYMMGNLSDIMNLFILWRLDALFGCGGANSEVDAWSGER